jgi:hypothetical protein
MWREEEDEDSGVVGGADMRMENAARGGSFSVRCIFGHLLEQRFRPPWQKKRGVLDTIVFLGIY